MSLLNRNRFYLIAMSALSLAMLSACGSDDSGSGSNGSGGSGGSGGSDGGSGGSGGGTTSSSGGTGGTTAQSEVLFDFASDLEGFEVGDDSGAAGAGGEGGAGSTIDLVNLSLVTEASHDSKEGSPEPGSMKLEIPFSNYGQGSTWQHIFEDYQDFSDSIITANIKLADDGGFTQNENAPGGMIFFMKSGENWSWGQVPWVNLNEPGDWIEVEFDPTLLELQWSEDFDPTQVKAIGFKFDTGSDPEDPPEGDLPKPATIWVDSITKKPL